MFRVYNEFCNFPNNSLIYWLRVLANPSIQLIIWPPLLSLTSWTFVSYGRETGQRAAFFCVKPRYSYPATAAQMYIKYECTMPIRQHLVVHPIFPYHLYLNAYPGRFFKRKLFIRDKTQHENWYTLHLLCNLFIIDIFDFFQIIYSMLNLYNLNNNPLVMAYSLFLFLYVYC